MTNVTTVVTRPAEQGGGVGGGGIATVHGGNIGIPQNGSAPNTGTGVTLGAQSVSLLGGLAIDLGTITGATTVTFTDFVAGNITPFVLTYNPNHFAMTFANASFPSAPATQNAAAYAAAEAAASRMVLSLIVLANGNIFITDWMTN